MASDCNNNLNANDGISAIYFYHLLQSLHTITTTDSRTNNCNENETICKIKLGKPHANCETKSSYIHTYTYSYTHTHTRTLIYRDIQTETAAFMILLLSLSLSLSLEHILPKLFHVWFHCRVYWRTLCPAHGVETNPRPTPRFSTFQNDESPGHLHYGFRICSLTNCSYKLISYDNFW